MELSQIKELLENPQIKDLVEAEIIKATEAKAAELDKAKTELVEEKAKAKKELFVHKKMLVAKANLYEQKLKAFNEAKLNEAIKKMSSDVYSFINESVTKVTTAIENDSKTNTQSAKITEAFSTAVKVMAPFINVPELEASNAAVVEGYKTKLNRALRENQELRSKVLSDDVQTLVVKECAGYSLEKQVVIINTLKELSPKTLTEAKDAIEKIKHELRAKVDPVVENKVVVEPVLENIENVDDAKAKLIALAESVKVKAAEQKKANPDQSKEMIDPTDVF